MSRKDEEYRAVAHEIDNANGGESFGESNFLAELPRRDEPVIGQRY